MSGPLAHLDALERALAAKGFPAMSPWWRATITRFYARRVRQLVIRAGRRAGKSSTLCRMAVLEALFGEHVIPPGDVGVVAIVSVSRDEANQRLRTVKAILDALGVKHRPIEGGIELEGRAIAFKVFSGSIAGVSGFTCIAALCDEVAKWRDSDTGANPAKEVLASLRPTMATQPRARIFLSSSPMSSLDAHAEAFDRGETEFQCVARAETWVANPSVTEAETRALEPDDRVWRREYAAIPQAAALGAFDETAVDRAFLPRVDMGTPRRRVMVLDPSSGRKDTWSYGICGWNLTATGSFLRFDLVDGIEGAFWGQLKGSAIVERVAGVAKSHDAASVHADQREALMLESEFSSNGLRYVVHDWTATSKPQAVERVRRWFADGSLSLPDHEPLRRELLSFEERITPAGTFTFGARGSGHDDYVALLLTAALADMADEIPQGSTQIFVPHLRPGRWGDYGRNRGW